MNGHEKAASLVLCETCGHPADRHDFGGGCGVTITPTKFCPCKVSFVYQRPTDSAVSP